MVQSKAVTPEQAFGEALRQVREKCKISQEELARLAGLDRTYVSSLERGLKSPTMRTLLRFAAVLNVPPSTIVRSMERKLG